MLNVRCWKPITVTVQKSIRAIFIISEPVSLVPASYGERDSQVVMVTETLHESLHVLDPLRPYTFKVRTYLSCRSQVFW